MLNFILIAVAAVLITIGLVKLVDKYIPSKFKPVLNIALWVLIAFFAYQTYMSVYTPILFNQERDKRYTKVISNLIDIRDSQLAYKQVNGKYAKTFDELVNFIETGKFTITQIRDEKVIDHEANARYNISTMTKDIVVVDTLGHVPVKDSLFKNSTRYKTMMNVPAGKPGAKFKLSAGIIKQSAIRIPVFEASVSKDLILHGLDKDLITAENNVISVEGVNGDAIRVGSMEEAVTNGNWPRTYGANE